MNFSHYTDEPLRLAVDLVNSLDVIDDVDVLDLAKLEEWLTSPELEDAPAASAADLVPMRHLRHRVREVFESESADVAVGRINRILEQAQAIPYVGVHSPDIGDGPHMHVAPRRNVVTGWFGAVIGMALAELVVKHGVTRFGVCSADDCRDVFIDVSRNHSRKHCSDRCTNREGVRSFRRRQSD
ncbi:MAG TPA: CGNR zinc finger domain-containing protein [Acidimicrobiia bacterium]|nr:CGNR zinc finger domain-containing protein [Acidimicrobiia bacterium]